MVWLIHSVLTLSGSKRFSIGKSKWWTKSCYIEKNTTFLKASRILTVIREISLSFRYTPFYRKWDAYHCLLSLEISTLLSALRIDGPRCEHACYCEITYIYTWYRPAWCQLAVFQTAYRKLFMEIISLLL